MAARRQRERGVQPTKWYLKWSLQVSINVALHVGKSLLEAVPCAEKYSWLRLGRATPFCEADSYADFGRESTEDTGHGMFASPGVARGARVESSPRAMLGTAVSGSFEISGIVYDGIANNGISGGSALIGGRAEEVESSPLEFAVVPPDRT